MAAPPPALAAMSPRNLLNIALAAFAIGLALIAYFRPGLEPPVAEQPVTTLHPAGINQVDISRLQRPALSFTRSDHGWLLAGNPALPASLFQVRSLLAILEAPAVRHYPADSLDLQKLGLDPPRATVTLDGTTVLGIGNTEPLDNLRYVLHAASVYLVEDRYQHLINADRTNFIERRLLDDTAVITRLVLPERTLDRSTDGEWESTPADPASSSEALQELVTNWQQASALFIRPFTGETGGASIRLDIAGRDQPVVFTLLSRTPELILASPELGIQYHFSKGMEKRLLEPGEATQPGAAAAGTTTTD